MRKNRTPTEAPRAFDLYRALAVFAKTVEMGSFRAAAKVLGVTPSVVSHHIGRLEEKTNTALIYRSTRQLSLTAEGRELLNAAMEMISAADKGLEQLSERSQSPTGTLSITAPASMIAEPLFEDLAAFAKLFPRVTLSMQFSDRQIDIIREGIDVAIRAGNLKDSSLRSKRLLDLKRILVASPSYVAGKAPPRHPKELSTWDWVSLCSRPNVALFSHRKVEVMFSSRISVDSGLALLGLARSGLGLAMVPSAMAQADLAANRVVEVLPEWPLEAPTVYAVWPANAGRASLTMRLIEFLTQRYAPRVTLPR